MLQFKSHTFWQIKLTFKLIQIYIAKLKTTEVRNHYKNSILNDYLTYFPEKISKSSFKQVQFS